MIVRKTIQFLLIANCRNGPLSANYDCKKNYNICQEKLYKILVIANCRNGLIFAFRDAAVVVFFLDRDCLIVDREMQGPDYLIELLFVFRSRFSRVDSKSHSLMSIKHGLLRAWNSVDLVPVNPKAAISSLHQVRIPSPH